MPCVMTVYVRAGSCNLDTQTIKHVLLHCPLLNDIRDKYGIVNVEDGVMNDGFLTEMESVFGI